MNFVTIIKIVKSNYIIFKTILLLACGVCTFQQEVSATPTRITLQDNDKATCKISVLKSSGDIQRGAYAKVFGNYEKFEADENGIITVEYINGGYSKNATLYLQGEDENHKLSVPLDAGKTEITVYFDRLSDILEYKRTARLFPLEGMVVDPEGNPIERATVSVQGTGRRTFTDESGLFNIEGDFNHSIVIRANGMNNLSLPITYFFKGEENFTIKMEHKNGWKVYSSAEIMPSFPGGMDAFQRYLTNNLEYPAKAKKAKKEGVVIVQFIVEKDGGISDPRIARHLETEMDSAAWRLIKDMPRWKPASDYGTTVRCKYSLPVAFKIPKPKPAAPVDSILLGGVTKDSLALDSTRLNKDLLTDSLKTDSLLQKDVQLTDSLQQDSTRMTVNKDQPVIKKKRNVFVRFFRWLFGIERRQRKRAEKAAVLLKAQLDSVQADSIQLNKQPNDTVKKLTKKDFEKVLKQVPKTNLEINSDSIKLKTDSLDVNVKELKQLKEKAKALSEKAD